ncbi:recombination endonuclease VII [Streptomyces mashuensis]|uniref:Recombination endonuclease VII n=1 Tax=Streptomyces mashuensis TaxID=33904 RepID=A0A919B848_9ACTN|nr:recombination endonuclease VII [Streptomyces mashuensis]
MGVGEIVDPLGDGVEYRYTCEQCAKGAVAFGSRGPVKRYCEECSKVRRRLRASGGARICHRADCGKEAAFNRKYCTEECRSIAWKSQIAGWQKANPEARSRARIKHCYGISLERYREIVSRPCAICGAYEQGGMHLDHCHRSGKVRGSLCKHHNWGIGNFRDNVDHLRAAIAYIEANRE